MNNEPQSRCPAKFTLKLKGLHMYEVAKVFPSKEMKSLQNGVTLVAQSNEKQRQ